MQLTIIQGAPKISYPLVLRTSPILNLVVRNPRVLVQKVLLKTQKQSGIYFTAYYHIISLFAGKLTGLVTKARFLTQMELVKKQMIEMAVEWRSFNGILNLILACVASVSVRFRSKERQRKGIFGFDRARTFTCSICRVVSLTLVPCS